MTILMPVLLAVAIQRGAELLLAGCNTRRLRAQGGIEFDPGGYRLLVALHLGWLCAIALALPADSGVSWPLLAVFWFLQLGRVWVIATLGGRWTTRVIVLPGAGLITHGPYRWCRHPNYLIVTAEIAVLPLAFGATRIAVVFSLCNLALLTRRISVEDAALGRRDPEGPPAGLCG